MPVIEKDPSAVRPEGAAHAFDADLNEIEHVKTSSDEYYSYRAR